MRHRRPLRIVRSFLFQKRKIIFLKKQFNEPSEPVGPIRLFKNRLCYHSAVGSLNFGNEPEGLSIFVSPSKKWGLSHILPRLVTFDMQPEHINVEALPHRNPSSRVCHLLRNECKVDLQFCLGARGGRGPDDRIPSVAGAVGSSSSLCVCVPFLFSEPVAAALPKCARVAKCVIRPVV